MKIATWNLESINPKTPERESAFRQTMREVDADIWILTEAWFNFGPGDEFSLVAQSSEAQDLADSPDRCWVSIWARASFNVQSLEPTVQRDRMARGRVQITGQRDIVVVGTVLPWASDSLFRGKKGYCEALRAQEVDWKKVSDADGCAFVVAGDFNQSLPYQQYYGSIDGAHALNAVLERHDLRCLTKSTEPPSDAAPAIDHICVSRSSIESSTPPIVEYRKSPIICKKPLSDHSITIVDIQLI